MFAVEQNPKFYKALSPLKKKMLNTRQTKRNNLHMNLIHSHLTNVKPGKEKN